jgi:hypothetical protein
MEIGEPIEAEMLARLEEKLPQRDAPTELLDLATEIDELGRRIALAIAQHPPRSELALPLRPVLLRVPVAYTRTLLRASERYDDIGSPRRAALVLVEALRKAFDANMVADVVEPLIFILEANEQPAAAARMRAFVTEPSDPNESRRERRERYFDAIEGLHAAIDWNALDDEPGTD